MDVILGWRTRNTTVLVKDYEISDIVSTTSVRQLFYNIVSPVDSMRVGKNEPHFLCKTSKRDETR
jgi:hypothetical protein